jgi:hypothetical protein
MSLSLPYITVCRSPSVAPRLFITFVRRLQDPLILKLQHSRAQHFTWNLLDEAIFFILQYIDHSLNWFAGFFRALYCRFLSCSVGFGLLVVPWLICLIKKTSNFSNPNDRCGRPFNLLTWQAHRHVLIHGVFSVLLPYSLYNKACYLLSIWHITYMFSYSSHTLIHPLLLPLADTIQRNWVFQLAMIFRSTIFTLVLWSADIVPYEAHYNIYV